MRLQWRLVGEEGLRRGWRLFQFQRQVIGRPRRARNHDSLIEKEIKLSLGLLDSHRTITMRRASTRVA
jgi:hypothetical protein